MRTVHLHDESKPFDHVAFGSSNVLVEVARDGQGARFHWKGQLVGIACPLVDADGAAVPLAIARESDGVELRGGPVERLALRVEGDVVQWSLSATRRVTGPSIRTLGTLEQGLLAGVEHLGKGETSSSTLDVERPEHIRFEPDPLLITMPLAAYVTDRGAVAQLWEDPTLQPVFSTPNRYDGTPDHYLALRGTNFGGRIRLGDGFAAGGRLEDAILWAARTRGIPPPPPTPRSPEAQQALCLQALTGTMRTAEGWYHAKWPGSPPAFFGDQASAVFRLTGRMPDVPRLVPGGAHVANPASFLVSGRTREWLNHLAGAAAQSRREQQPDGSFRYDGKYRRGHHEDTASGHCALRVLPLLEHARYTGDAESLAAALRALDFIRSHFRTPRGAQTWEMPLHTPDVYAAGLLVQDFVYAYEITGRREYLDAARQWALAGLPFVYQWDRYPVMRYATIGVLGATDWLGVCWIGLPVQWCGLNYAYALALLAPYDATLDWGTVSRGILVAAEQMQWPDGPDAGALPDSFNLVAQGRLPAPVNPCVPVFLRMRLDGRLDTIQVATNGAHRVVTPFAVRPGSADFDLVEPAPLPFDTVLNGREILRVEAGARRIPVPR